MRIGAGQARARVEAHLGRPPQDALEAAIVLEAWGGLRASSALELGAAVVDESVRAGGGGSPQAAPAPPAVSPPPHGVALATALLATVTWTTPLMHTFGIATFQRAWHIALPASLGAQWLLQRRLQGVLTLPRTVKAAGGLLGAIALVVAALGILGSAGLVAAGLGLAWLSVLVVVQRGWGYAYAGVLAACGVAMRLGLSGFGDIVLMLVVSTVGLAAGALTMPAELKRPAPWPLALLAGVAGAIVGMLLTLGARGPFAVNPDLAVLALMPALVGTLWSARYLNRLWELSGQPLLGAASQTGPVRRTAPLARGILLGAFLRLCTGVVVLSLTVVAAAVLMRGDLHVVASLLGVTSGLALVSLLVSLQEAFGRQGWAVLTAAMATAPLLLHSQGIGPWTQGEAVLASVVVGLAVFVWTVHCFLEDPNRSLVVAAL